MNEFGIYKSYAERLRNKVTAFRNTTATKKALFPTLITTYGLNNNRHADMGQNELTVDDLFRD